MVVNTVSKMTVSIEKFNTPSLEPRSFRQLEKWVRRTSKDIIPIREPKILIRGAKIIIALWNHRSGSINFEFHSFFDNDKFLSLRSDFKTQIMKEGIHPEEYRMVVFKDVSNDTAFLTRSCTDTTETIKWEDGNEYPLVKLEISNTSHPFYTGKMTLVDTAGRIDKFKNRYAKHKKPVETPAEKEESED